MRDLTFPSQGERCAAWWFEARGDEFAGRRGHPCVVMAPGLGSTRDSGLAAYAERFAAAGLSTLLFDYRHMGASGGEPRQLASARRQHEDYRAAIAHARSRGDVDPERVVLWGVSYAGGHVVPVAADDRRIAAVISLTPALDGRAIVLESLRREGLASLLRASAHGVRDLARAATLRAPHYVPLGGGPGSGAAITDPPVVASLLDKAGPTWRNEIAARSLLALGSYRPGRRAAELPCPWLVQVGERDRLAPADAAARVALQATGRAEVRHYPIDHLDVYEDGVVDHLADDQLHFIARHLGPAEAAPASGGPAQAGRAEVPA